MYAGAVVHASVSAYAGGVVLTAVVFCARRLLLRLQGLACFCARVGYLGPTMARNLFFGSLGGNGRDPPKKSRHGGRSVATKSDLQRSQRF